MKTASRNEPIFCLQTMLSKSGDLYNPTYWIVLLGNYMELIYKLNSWYEKGNEHAYG